MTLTARVYDPVLGRFLQTDPIGYRDDLNLYAYVDNDPLNKTDPNGMEGACLYSPGVCGGRQLTPEQQEDREETARTVGEAAVTAASFLPLGRPFAWAARALGVGKLARVGSFQAAKGLISSRYALGEATKGRTMQFIGSGGRGGAERLFRKLTDWGNRDINGSRTVVGSLRDGTKVNIRTEALSDGIQRTTVEAQRMRTGSRIPERIKVRFDEKLRD